jgi:TfoX/Sxy family transcriptional regulator of competence genes
MFCSTEELSHKGSTSPPELIERLARLVPQLPGIEQRNMFGYPALFLNGNMLAELFGHGMVLRLPEQERQALTTAGQAVPFVAMGGRVMREWVIVDEPQRIPDGALGELLEAARRCAAAKPPKAKKPARRRAR